MYEHFCQVLPVFTLETDSDNTALPTKPPTRLSAPQVPAKHSSTVRLYPDTLLPLETKAKYKGRHPQNTCNQLLELQHIFDELEALGVFIQAPRRC